MVCSILCMGVLSGEPPSLGRSKPAMAQAAASERPPCPPGWADVKNPTIGMKAYVPPDYWVRLRGGVMLTVERQNNPATMAFMMPFRCAPADEGGRFPAHREG
jgi:hypothetical protein